MLKTPLKSAKNSFKNAKNSFQNAKKPPQGWGFTRKMLFFHVFLFFWGINGAGSVGVATKK